MLNTKLFLSGATILAASALIIGATFAFFSDTETSAGNTLVAGALDLKIDNESYYNGVLNAGTSWLEKDLESGDFFYNFNDVKPGDFGEDTISLHIINNDAWVCTETTITSDDDVSCSEPETADDPACTDPGAPGNTNDFDGDLADELEIMWWADDGDNVLESDEQVIDIGAIGQGPQNVPVSRPIADSANNIFSNSPNDPLEGGDIGPIHYIAKAWCFGNMTPAGLPQSNYSGPDIATNAADLGLVTSEDGGFTCDASAVVGNAAITDKVMMDVSFSAVQSRSNSGFVCGQPNVTPTPTLSPTPSVSPVPSEPFADSVTAVSGTFGHCCNAGDLSSSTAVASASITGAPDSPPDADFIQISAGSSVTARFDNNKAIDGPGNDIRIHTYDLLFPADANIEISADPACLAGFSAPVVRQDTVNGEIDLASLSPALTEARCVRITDLGGPDTTFPTLGFDLDAIEAINSVVFP